MDKGLKREVIKENSSRLVRGISWIFGILVFLDGLLNLFRGNDPGLGFAFLILSLIYFPPVGRLIRSNLGFGIPVIIKILLGIAILWISLTGGAVAEGFYPEITG